MGPNDKKTIVEEKHLMDDIEENFSNDEDYIDLIVSAFENNDDDEETKNADEDSILAEFGYMNEDE